MARLDLLDAAGPEGSRIHGITALQKFRESDVPSFRTTKKYKKLPDCQQRVVSSSTTDSSSWKGKLRTKTLPTSTVDLFPLLVEALPHYPVSPITKVRPKGLGRQKS